MVKRKKWGFAISLAIVIGIVYFSMNAPIVAGDWTKQTIYLWGLNSCHIQTKNAKPKIQLIDDDSGYGVYAIKRLCDELQIKMAFAIIPSMMSQEIKDSLKIWQKQGYSIALHGYKHDDWREWKYEDVLNDISKCELWLEISGFDTKRVKYVVTPRGSNTKAVRKAVKNKGYLMITGANIVNPDTEVFLNGRVFINQSTKLKDMEILLRRTKERKGYLILATHSSMPKEFSLEKTKAVLQIAIDMGFEFIQ